MNPIQEIEKLKGVPLHSQKIVNLSQAYWTQDILIWSGDITVLIRSGQ